tara:strand:- start:581 stop:1672 length:1092 start_codon:yes stop_codon:yes gene_type:complete
VPKSSLNIEAPRRSAGLDWLAKNLLAWFEVHGRKDLPWQVNRTSYRVWISEIMLQQTQVKTVIPYYKKFMQRFPRISDLAKADLDEVLHFWTGLGYYSRARNMHITAQRVEKQFKGILPTKIEDLMELPGIGRSTAGAILALSYGKPAAILDANVKRVLARFHAIGGYPESAATSKTLWQQAEKHIPQNKAAEYTQAIMDLGATICTRDPRCEFCPLLDRCKAYVAEKQHLYPEKRPIQKKRIKEVRMFIIGNSNGEYLLQKRPDTGIWAQLWSLPERPASYTPEEMINELQHLGKSQYSAVTGPEIEHSFSHFKLNIEPIHIDLKVSLKTQNKQQWRWYHPEKNQRIGLAGPVSKLLNREYQ